MIVADVRTGVGFSN